MLTSTITRQCLCGLSSGKYRDDGLCAEFTGPARIIGMLNNEYLSSLNVKVIPFKTYYKWFPILSNEQNHVYDLNVKPKIS